METAIEIKNVTKSYKGVCALEGLTLKVPAGKVYGLLGENGAGKTTTLRTVIGLIRPNEGDVMVMGERVSTKKPNAGRNMGAIIEAPGLYGNLTARENIHIVAAINGVPKDGTEGLLETVGLKDTGRKKVKTFSTGMKQRLGIACALVASPKILILDEPTVGLDPQGVIDMRRLIKKLAGEMQMTVVISSHILAEVEQVADMVGIIHQGRLIEEFDIEAVKEGGTESAMSNLEKRFLAAVNGKAGEGER